MEAHMNYARTFGAHSFSGLILYTQMKASNDLFSATRKNFPTSALDQFNVGDTGPGMSTDFSAGIDARRGYVGRLTYSYADKYLLEANFRYDASFNFPVNKRWGFFPSISAGWVLSEENFLKNSGSFLSFLKLRASYGQLGNDKVNQFQYLQKYAFTGNGYVFGDNPSTNKSINASVLPNPNITWERVTKTDIGLESKFLNGLFSLEADYFFEHRTNILRTRNISVPSTFGALLPDENIGIIDKKGFELALAHQKSIGNLNYFVRGNFTYVTNKVIFIDEPNDVIPAIKQTGRPLGTYFGLKSNGFFQTADEVKASPTQFGTVAPGDIKYQDTNGDGKIDNADYVQIGKSNIPQIMYGFSAGASFKGIDFSILFQGAGQVNQYLQEVTWAFGDGSGKVTESHLNRWTPSNPNASYPRLTLGQSNNGQYSNFWLYNASYLRLKNMEIGYNLPKDLISKIKIKGLRIYANGQNLATFSKIKVVDPELDNYRGFGYPQQKVYNFGINVQF